MGYIRNANVVTEEENLEAKFEMNTETSTTQAEVAMGGQSPRSGKRRRKSMGEVGKDLTTVLSFLARRQALDQARVQINCGFKQALEALHGEISA